MKQKFLVQKLLHTMDQSYVKELWLSPGDETNLKKIRKEVRSVLRAGFAEIRSAAHSQFRKDWIEAAAHLVPKFWTQGSFAYGTLNRPAHAPPQQIDLDDGVYFPMDFVEREPGMAKETILQIVDHILERYCDLKGYQYKRKRTCGRIEVGNGSHIHVDIPVYAIPKERHRVMSAEASRHIGAVDFSAESMRLDPTEVYLALRDDEHWTRSDPMEIGHWFKGRTAIFPRLRRVCRYVKGWRDYQWRAGGPSSIALMTAVVETFEQHLKDSSLQFETDCEALLAVARALPEQLSGTIINRANTHGEVLFPRGQSDTELGEIKCKAEFFRECIERALCRDHGKQEVVAYLRNAFGPRLPDRSDWVEVIVSPAQIDPLRRHPVFPAAPTNYRSG